MTKSTTQTRRGPTPSLLQMRITHEEWLIDEAIRDSFPASDPTSTSQPGSIAQVRYAEP
jgi:P pilus assembly chaperone PapD